VSARVPVWASPRRALLPSNQPSCATDAVLCAWAAFSQLWGRWTDYNAERRNHRALAVSILVRRRRATHFTAWASTTTAAACLRRKLELFRRKHCAQQAWCAWFEFLRDNEIERRVEAMHDDTKLEDNEIKKQLALKCVSLPDQRPRQHMKSTACLAVKEPKRTWGKVGFRATFLDLTTAFVFTCSALLVCCAKACRGPQHLRPATACVCHRSFAPSPLPVAPNEMMHERARLLPRLAYTHK
jgi:hypothetical protein